MQFQDFIRSGKVKTINPNHSLAEGLLKNAEEDLTILQTITITHKNASFFFKSGYDCVRASLESFLAKQGYKSYSHEATLQFLLEMNILNKKTHNKLDLYRMQRNDITYRAETATKQETQEIILFAGKILPKMKKLLYHQKKTL